MDTIVIAILSLCGTMFGSLAGIMTANKLSNYRIEQLEKKQDKHNQLIERFAILDKDNSTQWNRIDELKNGLEEIKKEVYSHE